MVILSERIVSLQRAISAFRNISSWEGTLPTISAPTNARRVRTSSSASERFSSYDGEAIGRGFRHQLAAKNPRRATPIVDNHPSTETVGEFGTEHARDGVGATSRRKGHDET